MKRTALTLTGLLMGGAAAWGQKPPLLPEKEVLAIAQGETARFDQVLAQYKQAPGVTRERMYLETMENVYKNSRKVIVDAKGGNNVMYLPLDKIISALPQNMSNPNDTMTVAPARPADAPAPAPDDPSRARGVR